MSVQWQDLVFVMVTMYYLQSSAAAMNAMAWDPVGYMYVAPIHR
jgi:hypothetical protein